MSKPLPSPVPRNAYSPNTTPTSAYTPNTPTFSPHSTPTNPFPQGQQYNPNQKQPLYNPGTPSQRMNAYPNPQQGTNQQPQQYTANGSNNQQGNNQQPQQYPANGSNNHPQGNQQNNFNPQQNQMQGHQPQQFQQGQQGQYQAPQYGQAPRISTNYNPQQPNTNYTPNAYPQPNQMNNQMPTSNPNSNPMQRTSDRLPPISTTNHVQSNPSQQTANSASNSPMMSPSAQRPVAKPTTNPLLANSLKLPLKNPTLKMPMKTTPIVTAPVVIEVAEEKFELINYTLTEYAVEYLEEGRIIPKTTPGTFPIPEIHPKPTKEDISITKFPKISEPMVLQAPKPRSAKKNPSSARSHSFNPKSSDVRKEELGVHDPRDDRRASESKAAEVSRQHVRPAITRTETDPDASSPRNQASPRYDTNPKVRGLGTTPSASPLHKPGSAHPGISRINSTPNLNAPQYRQEGQDIDLNPLQSPALGRTKPAQYKPQAYQPQAYQPQPVKQNSATSDEQQQQNEQPKVDAPTTLQIQQMQMEKQLEMERKMQQQQSKDGPELEQQPQQQFGNFPSVRKDRIVHRVSKGTLAIGVKGDSNK